MTKKENLLKKFLQNPEALRSMEIECLLRGFGFERVGLRGSHVKLRHSRSGQSLIMPVHNNDCKGVYKKLIAKLIKEKLYEN